MAYHPYHFVGEVLLRPVYIYFFIHCYLETLQHLGHIASRIFGCVPEGCVFVLLCVVNVSIKFTELIL